jgi:hypothetical protein
MDDWDLESPKAKKGDPSGGITPRGASEPAASGLPQGALAPIGQSAGGKAVSKPVAGMPVVPEPAAGEQAPPARGRRWKLSRIVMVVIGGLVLILIGALAGFFIARAQNTTVSDELAGIRQQLAVAESGLKESEERNWNYYRQDQALKAQIEELQNGPGATSSSSTTTTAPGGRVSYTDGIYMVGEDIQPGDYDGVVTGKAGYWARLRGTDGNVGAIEANGLETGAFVLTINTSDVAVELRGVKITSR